MILHTWLASLGNFGTFFDDDFPLFQIQLDKIIYPVIY